MVITGVADRVPERLAHLVYLDAPVPHDGESPLDHLRSEVGAAYRATVERDGDGWQLPPPVAPAMADRWPYRLFRPQSFASLTQPLRLLHPSPPLPRTYILCTAKPPE